MNEYLEYKPTLIERIWKKLGYRYHHGEEPEGVEKLTGWMMTDNIFKFSFLDRVRLLFSGTLKISIAQHMDAQPDISKNRVDWYIKPPTRH